MTKQETIDRFIQVTMQMKKLDKEKESLKPKIKEYMGKRNELRGKSGGIFKEDTERRSILPDKFKKFVRPTQFADCIGITITKALRYVTEDTIDLCSESTPVTKYHVCKDKEEFKKKIAKK